MKQLSLYTLIPSGGWGLVDIETRNQLNLKNVTVDVNMIDLVAQVKIRKEYQNIDSDNNSLQYDFPLDELCCVTAFRAMIDDEIIIGKIFEKEEAKAKYDKAISENKTALLLDNSETKPDMFSITLGNFPKNCTIIIELE
jgi:Ca-activated chloride channel family protein